MRSSFFLSFRFFFSIAVLSVVLTSGCSGEEAAGTDPFVYTIHKDSIMTVSTAEQFQGIMDAISKKTDALFVFDIDNTLLITNDNLFGSDWWFSQSSKNANLKLQIDDSCLYNVLTPLFYSAFNTKPVFDGQAASLDKLKSQGNKTIALTSRAYSPVISNATELELRKNLFTFMGKDSTAMDNGFILLNDIIYTAGGNKGTALTEYIAAHPYSHVFYFDDSENKVVDVQRAFEKVTTPISLFHLTIAPKIPYSPTEVKYMQDKLRVVVETVNNVGKTSCKCTEE